MDKASTGASWSDFGPRSVKLESERGRGSVSVRGGGRRISRSVLPLLDALIGSSLRCLAA
ncbi:hypothetical protein Areg01_25260 [Actinoplanes regularis]|nr:hypothetical protein Areg01_25260 [Actinoplanes regularis]